MAALSIPAKMEPMDHSARIELEALMQRQGWIRALARSLVGDAAAAEDLAQDAWVAALERGPRDGSNLRGWLRRVLANLARQRWRAEESRRTRETHVARHEAQADELASRLETFEFVVSAVRELDEPYRTVVLLRYFEELTPRQIAERLEVPLGTVETRLHRALERLRAKLDRRTGDRATWIAFVAPLAQLAKSSSGALAWSWIVKVQTKIALVMLALLLLSLVAFFALRSANEAQAERTVKTATAPKPGDADAKLANSSAPSERSALATPIESTSVAAPSVVAIRGVVVDCDDRVLANVKVAARASESSPSSAQTTSDADGRFALSPAPASGLVDCVDERFVGVLRPRFDSSSRELDQVLVVAPRRSLHGIVENAEDVPIGGAVVLVELAWGFRERFARSLIDSESRIWSARCDPSGAFAIEDLVELGDVQLRAQAQGYLQCVAKLSDLPASGVVLRLPDSRVEGPTLAGRVVDDHGVGVVGAVVELGDAARPHKQFSSPNHVSTDANGDFRIAFPEGAPISRIVMRAFADGRLPVEIVREGSEATRRDAWPSPLVIELTQVTKSIAGRVIESDGTPVAGCALWIEDPTPFGVFEAASQPLIATSDVDLETLLAGGIAPSFVHDSSHARTTDIEGRFEVRGLLDRKYQLVSLDPVHMRFVVTPPIDAGAKGIVLTLPALDFGRRIAGRVVDAQGKAVAGVELTPCGREPESSGSNRTIPATGRRIRSDSDGRFEFTGVHAVGLSILARPSDRHLIGAEVDLDDSAHDDVIIRLAKACFVRVDARGLGDKKLAQIHVCGERRVTLPLLEGEHPDDPWQTSLQVHGAVSPVFAVPENALELSLRYSDGDVVFVPLHFGDDAITIVKP